MVSTDVLNAFYSTTLRVFRETTGEELRRTSLQLAPMVARTEEELAVIIGVTGDLVGNVMLEMQRGVGKRVASAMAGFDVLTYDPLVESAVGELANMVVGRASGELESLGLRCHIAPPAVVTGRGVVVEPVGIQAIQAAFASRWGELLLVIALREAEMG